MNGLRREPVQIGWLAPGYMKAIGASTPVVWLSAYTIDHIALGHREEYYELFKLTPTIIAKGECRTGRRRRDIIFLWSPLEELDKPYRSFVKASRDGKEVFLDSTHRIEPRQVNNILKKSQPVPKYL